MKNDSYTSSDCAWAIRAIDSHLDGELTLSEEKQLTTHLQECTSCKREMTAALELKQILALGDLSMVLDDPLEESTEIVMSRIQFVEQSRKISKIPDDRRAWVAGGLSLAASLLIFSVLMWYGNRMMREESDFASSPRKTNQLSSPMLTSVSFSSQSNHAGGLTAEEELLATGMMTLATPGIMSRIETVAMLNLQAQSNTTSGIDRGENKTPATEPR